METLGKDVIFIICRLLGGVHDCHNFMICSRTIWLATRNHPFRHLREQACGSKWSHISGWSYVVCVKCGLVIKRKVRHANRCKGIFSSAHFWALSEIYQRQDAFFSYDRRRNVGQLFHCKGCKSERVCIL